MIRFAPSLLLVTIAALVPALTLIAGLLAGLTLVAAVERILIEFYP